MSRKINDISDAETRGKIHGNTELRATSDLFIGFSRRKDLDELYETVQTLLIALTHGNLDEFQELKNLTNQIAKERREQIESEEIRKVMGLKELEQLSVERSIALLEQSMSPFVDGKQRLWTDTFKDAETKQKTPTVLEMVLTVCPAILDRKSVLDEKAYIQELQKSYDNFEVVYSYERENLSVEQRRSGVERFGHIVIKLKACLSPSI